MPHCAFFLLTPSGWEEYSALAMLPCPGDTPKKLPNFVGQAKEQGFMVDIGFAPAAEYFPGEFGNHSFRTVASNQQAFLEGAFCSGMKGDENVAAPLPRITDCIGIQSALNRPIVVDSAFAVPVRA